MKKNRQRANRNKSIISRRHFLLRSGLGIGGAVLSPALNPGLLSAASPDRPARGLIGFTKFRTNLPGGRHANGITMRACVARADGTRHRFLAGQLAGKPNTWTQFAGWSQDGPQAIIGCGWESPENAAWEEEHKTFRFT